MINIRFPLYTMSTGTWNAPGAKLSSEFRCSAGMPCACGASEYRGNADSLTKELDSRELVRVCKYIYCRLSDVVMRTLTRTLLHELGTKMAT